MIITIEIDDATLDDLWVNYYTQEPDVKISKEEWIKTQLEAMIKNQMEQLMIQIISQQISTQIAERIRNIAVSIIRAAK